MLICGYSGQLAEHFLLKWCDPMMLGQWDRVQLICLRSIPLCVSQIIGRFGDSRGFLFFLSSDACVECLVWRDLKRQMVGFWAWRSASTAVIRKFKARIVDQISVFSAALGALLLARVSCHRSFFACSYFLELHWVIDFCDLKVSALIVQCHCLKWSTILMVSTTLHGEVHFLLGGVLLCLFNSSCLWKQLVWIVNYHILSKLLTIVFIFTLFRLFCIAGFTSWYLFKALGHLKLISASFMAGPTYSDTMVMPLEIFSPMILSICTLSYKLVMTTSLNLKASVFLINETAISAIRIATNFFIFSAVSVLESLLRRMR